MKLIRITTIAFCLCAVSSFAQDRYTIKGAAVDTDLRIKLYNTTISVLNAKDSILRKFTRATDNGSFSLGGLPAGKFILLVSYPDYADYVETFTLDPTHTSHDFGNINMRLKVKILQEVLIKGEVKAIKLKGDTTEFNAKAYTIQPNDKVEDLLKQLPGIQVDKDGKITANGEAVTKVLLDGEEFFGDDPTLVTKNIRADMVEKFQLYDKKSDQAAFTGIDDGVKTKTINVVLKQDKKKGTFGKVTGGVGDEQYYEGQALFNKFTARQKYAIYGTAANDGKAGLGYADQDKIGASNSNIQIDGGITYISFGNGDQDFQSNYNGNGSPLARTGGAHYDGKWDNDKQTINTNYKIGSLEVTGDFNNTQQANFGGGIVQNTKQLRTFDNYTFKQKLDVAYTAKIDTSANIKITADGAQRNAHNKSNSFTSLTDGSGNLLNTAAEGLDNNYSEKIYDLTALYTKKLKKGRTFSWNISEAYDETTIKGYQNSVTNFYNKAGVIDSTNVVNQYKPSITTSSVLNSNMTFSQPLTKKFAVTFNWGFALNNSSADRESFDQSSPGNYNVLVDSLSSNYKFNQITNQLGAIFNYRFNKTILNFGTKASDVNFKQVDENTGSILKRNFINWLPQANLQYRINQSKTLSINYNGSTTQPTLDQIQPVASNVNPTNITIGNPNLKPSFNDRFLLQYISSQIINQQLIAFFINYSFTSDAIINKVITNSAGKSTTQYVNLTGNKPYNYNLNGQYSRKIVPIDATIGLNLSANGNTGYSYVNNLATNEAELDKSTTTNLAATLVLRKSKAKNYDFSIQGGPGYQFSKFSIQAENNNAPTFNSRVSGTIYLPLKFQVASDITYSYSGKTQSQSELERALWNASISKTILKDDNLKFSLAANNLLDQNPTINRNVNGNIISQSYYNSVKRFFMFSVTWDFTKFGTTPSKN